MPRTPGHVPNPAFRILVPTEGGRKKLEILSRTAGKDRVAGGVTIRHRPGSRTTRVIVADWLLGDTRHRAGLRGGVGRSVEIVAMRARVSFDGACLRVSDPRVFSHANRGFVRTLARELAAAPAVARARFDLETGGCAVLGAEGHANLRSLSAAFVAAVAAAVGHGPSAPGLQDFAAVGTDAPIVIVKGAKRVLYGAAGAGCLLMTVVGAVLPGIPSVPFLLGASYFLARSSKRLHSTLLATPVCGRIVREWEVHHGLSRESKGMLVGCTVLVVMATVSFTGPEPIVLVVVATVLTMSSVGIARLPAI